MDIDGGRYHQVILLCLGINIEHIPSTLWSSEYYGVLWSTMEARVGLAQEYLPCDFVKKDLLKKKKFLPLLLKN